jgi:flagellum-specific ATP synthase
MRQTSLAIRADACCGAFGRIPPIRLAGRVAGVAGLIVDIDGLAGHVSIGDRLLLETRDGRTVPAEIVGFRADLAQAMPFEAIEGLGPGSSAVSAAEAESRFAVSDDWLGRVLDPLGRPLDGKGALPLGTAPRALRAAAPEATSRARLGLRLDLGVRALNCFTTCRQGQRLGLFSGSGIGKSTLLAMLARQTQCDLVVLALVGERGREVREFLEDDLGPEGLARSVVVVATSDAPRCCGGKPLMRQ